MKPLAVCDVFLVAAARLARAPEMVRGDYRGIGDDASCPVDLIGAINYACCGEAGVANHSFEALAVLVDMLDLNTRLDPVDAVAAWCDAEGRTKDECVEVLDQARERTEWRA